MITFPKDEYLFNFQRSMKLLEHNFRNKHFGITKLEEILLYLLEKYPNQTKGFIAGAINKTQNSLAQVIQNNKFN